MKRSYIIFAFSTIAIIILLFFLRRHGADFREKHSVTTGIITSTDGGGRGNWGPGIYYEYYVSGKKIKGSRRHAQLPYAIGEKIMGKSFPVAYEKYWYGYEDNILITPTDFKNYGHPFPDSLRWILQHIKKD